MSIRAFLKFFGKKKPKIKSTTSCKAESFEAAKRRDFHRY
jgi:hypothetical protein